MFKKIIAITFIFVCTSASWLFLAGTMLVRSEGQSSKLHGAVGQLWGTTQVQREPRVYYTKPSDSSQKNLQRHISVDASDIEVDLSLDYRKKGLIWYSTYRVKFSGTYRIAPESNSGKPNLLYLTFALPAKGAIYDNFHLFVGDNEIENINLDSDSFTAQIEVPSGETKEVRISYESQGMEEWYYKFGDDVSQVKNFSLSVNTNFDEVDFPEDSISPTDKVKTAEGWKLTWDYENLLTGVKIGVIAPQKLNPGPWAAKVTSAAPVSLFLYFFILFVLTTVRKIKIHPMNYFFVGTAFFSFHLLLGYLVDHVSIHTSFWICSAVSIFLVVSYMRLVVGARVAFFEIAFSQLVYLVLFSYTFFFKGYTGLSITILCICTLFVVMQTTGRVDWEKVFERAKNCDKEACEETSQEKQE